MHTCMKTITIKDEIYRGLKNLKLEGESFSDVIARLLARRGLKIDDYFGALGNNPILEELEEASRKTRESARLRT